MKINWSTTNRVHTKFAIWNSHAEFISASQLYQEILKQVQDDSYDYSYCEFGMHPTNQIQ